MSRTLDSTPGLTRLSQEDGSALWRVDRQVSRAAIVPKSGDPMPVAAGPVELHTNIPAGEEGRTLRLADAADDGWTATLDGRPLTRTTLDGWAQGFELPASGGSLDVTYETPLGHTGWLWAQGALAVVLVVMALPGRRRQVDDDLPDEPVIPAQPVEGEGRRARRLRAAQAEQDAAQGDAGQDDAGTPVPPPEEEAFAAVPQQASYEEWEAPAHAGADYGTYQGEQQYQDAQYQDAQYQTGGYDQSAYQDPYQGGQYDPYAYGGAQGGGEQYGQPYDATYGQQQPPMPPQPPQPPHGTDSERPDGSQQ